MADLWNDEKQIDYDMNQAYKINISIGRVLRLVDDIEERRLPNIGIYFNNKLVETYRYLKEHNMPYFLSGVRSAVFDYLMTIIERAAMAIDRYAHNVNNQSVISIFSEIKTDSDSLEEYENMCNKLYDFNIERDIEQAIKLHLDKYINREYYIGDVNEVIDKTNDELKQLGFSISFEHMDGPAKWTPGKITPELLEKMEQELAKMQSETESINGRTPR